MGLTPETVSPTRCGGVWLAGGRLPISADPPLARLVNGVESVASIRAEIAYAAKVATMPVVEVVPYIWTRERLLICGRVTALRQGDGTYFGVQIPAPTALCTDHAAVRALLVHEFAHWFYLATRVVCGPEPGEKEAAFWIYGLRGLQNRTRRSTFRTGLGKKMRGGSSSTAIRRRARFRARPTGLEKQFYVVSPRLGDTVRGIEISNDVRAHIRRLRTPTHLLQQGR